MVVRGPNAPLHWFVAQDNDPAGLFSGAVAASARFVVRGLTPSIKATVRITTLDVNGVERRHVATVKTQAPMLHVVLNEVYANPAGSEFAQEWVEVYNDGLSSASLDGLVLRDEDGESALPSGELRPGEYALLARNDLNTSNGVDHPIPSGCAILRMDALGKNGLGNWGEELWLVDADGATVSHFVPPSAAEERESAVRARPDAQDDDPASFTKTWLVTPCEPKWR